MEYMLMIFSDPEGWARLTPPQAAEGLAAYGAYHEALQKAGVLRSSARLRPAHTATTVRLQSGKSQVLDGPFIETREQLGGYFRIEVPDLVPRVLMNGGFDYWESGMDLPMGADFFDSFVNYQTRVIQELDALARDYEFETLDATRPIEELQDHLSRRVLRLLARTPHEDAAPAERVP